MGLLDDIKARLQQVAEKTPDIKEDTVDKIRKVGEEGLQITQDLFNNISNKVSDITILTRLQFGIKEMEKEIRKEYLILGKLSLRIQNSKKLTDSHKELFSEQINKVGKIKADHSKKTVEYEQIKKERSDNYIIQKLSDELTDAGAVIDQVVISEGSDVTGKLLKEILLPKEALISVIKRGAEVIIPDGNTQLLTGDQVTVIGKEGDVTKVRKRLSLAV